MIKVTVAVITFRRPMWLQRLLLELKKQKVDSNVEMHIQVVDNDGNEETEQVVSTCAQDSVFKMSYAVESNPGIVSARNKCVELFLQSESDYLIFIDDDEWPENERWAQRLIDGRDEFDADIVSSHVLGVGEEDTPDWALKIIHGVPSAKPGQNMPVFYTNNLLLSRKVLQSVQPAFDHRFAMTGASDYHFALKCMKQGFKSVYIDNPVIEEFPQSRSTVSWFTRRGYRSGIGYTKAHIYEEGLNRTLMRGVPMSFVRAARGLLYLILGLVTFDKAKMVNGMFRVCSSVGTLAGFLGLQHEEYKNIHGR